jgi:hypothetical protein
MNKIAQLPLDSDREIADAVRLSAQELNRALAAAQRHGLSVAITVSVPTMGSSMTVLNQHDQVMNVLVERHTTEEL